MLNSETSATAYNGNRRKADAFLVADIFWNIRPRGNNIFYVRLRPARRREIETIESATAVVTKRAVSVLAIRREPRNSQGIERVVIYNIIHDPGRYLITNQYIKPDAVTDQRAIIKKNFTVGREFENFSKIAVKGGISNVISNRVIYYRS